MNAIQIIVGSMLGGTEYVAEACEETLNKLDRNVDIHLKPDLKTILNNTFSAINDLGLVQENSNISSKSPVWIICTSTHGAGEYPDNIQQFVSDLTNCDQDLSTVSFLTIGIGDSNYDTFCKAAKDISKLLISIGCKELIALKTFDMAADIDPEDLAQQWISTNKDLF
ncbi:flavodoxin domain-containing protein [Colwellia sp. E2M01]|uniref:flavodoxin domain-containing protein n=1 Tax=Colwellia sp. E2M01 TaxID=2841561 RepID=UPI001C08C676|nr:flavodoxin domain-containing protein [Colwellia sp. E2M01]MBU2870964.1 flavodoxin domain-containing protein [Colwellia sp. E2M01]